MDMLQGALMPRLPGPGAHIVFREHLHRTASAPHFGRAVAGQPRDTDQIGVVERLLPWGLLIRTAQGWRTCISLTDLFAGHVTVAEPGISRRAVDHVRSLLGGTHMRWASAAAAPSSAPPAARPVVPRLFPRAL